jgi:hypothetical protein
MPSRVLALGWLFVGLTYVADGMSDYSSSIEVDALPDWLILLLGTMLTIAGAVITTATVWRPRNVAMRWALERAGWWLAAGAWGACLTGYGLGHASNAASLLMPLSWIGAAAYAVQRLHQAETRDRQTSAVDL